MNRTDELLVPLVNAPHQRAAVERALQSAPGSDVTVLNVVTPLDEPLSEGRLLSVTDERLDEARARTRRIVETTTGRRETAVEVEVAEGRPARTVADRAAERGTDRIVVGGRDPSTLSRLLFGRSVATVIDDLSEVPVTVVDDPE